MPQLLQQVQPLQQVKPLQQVQPLQQVKPLQPLPLPLPLSSCSSALAKRTSNLRSLPLSHPQASSLPPPHRHEVSSMQPVAFPYAFVPAHVASYLSPLPSPTPPALSLVSLSHPLPLFPSSISLEPPLTSEPLEPPPSSLELLQACMTQSIPSRLHRLLSATSKPMISHV